MNISDDFRRFPFVTATYHSAHYHSAKRDRSQEWVR